MSDREAERTEGQEYLRHLARPQAEAGAAFLDLNVEPAALHEHLEEIRRGLQLDMLHALDTLLQRVPRSRSPRH
jgi:hypothetical protein